MTIKEIEKLVEDCKDLTDDEARKIAYSLGITECALFVNLFERRYGRKVLL